MSFGGEAQESWPNDKLNLKPETSQVPSLLCQRQEARKIPAAAMVITLSAKTMPLILRLLKAAVILPRNSKDET